MQAARQTVPDDNDDDYEHIVYEWHDPQDDDHFFDCEEMAHHDGPVDH